MAEQGYIAVLAVIKDGRPVTETAAAVGVSRQTLHVWLARYEAEGLEGLADRSHRPAGHPLQMPAEVEVVVLEARRKHPSWGPRRIATELGRKDSRPVRACGWSDRRSGDRRLCHRAGVRPNEGDGTVTVLHTRTRKVVKMIAVGFDSGTGPVAIDSAAGPAYLPVAQGGTIAVIDTRLLRSRGEFPAQRPNRAGVTSQ